MFGRHLDQKSVMLALNVSRRDGVDVVEVPYALFADELGAQKRRGEQVVEMKRQPLVPFRDVLAEIDAQRERLSLYRTQAALDQLIEFVVHDAHERRRFEVLDRRNTGQRFMTARRREERHIVPDTLVPVRFA
jgi:hypothetical protein